MASVESLQREVSSLKEQLISLKRQLQQKEEEVKLKEGQLRTFVRGATPFTPRKTTEAEWRPASPVSPAMGKRDLGSMVEQVLDGGRKRRVGGWGIPFDPEGLKEKGVVVGIKVGGVMWEVGIGGVRAALEEEGFVVCDGARWLVDGKEVERRKLMGKTSSTVVAFVRGLEDARRLMKRGLWLSGRWHSVRRFEAVQPARKKSGWVWVEERLKSLEEGERRGNRKVEAILDGEFKAVRRSVVELGVQVKRYEMERKEELEKMRKVDVEMKEERVDKGKGVAGEKKSFSFSGMDGGVKEFVAGQGTRPIASLVLGGAPTGEGFGGPWIGGRCWKCKACGVLLGGKEQPKCGGCLGHSRLGLWDPIKGRWKN